jgi:hypothetical protein
MRLLSFYFYGSVVGRRAWVFYVTLDVTTLGRLWDSGDMQFSFFIENESAARPSNVQLKRRPSSTPHYSPHYFLLPPKADSLRKKKRKGNDTIAWQQDHFEVSREKLNCCWEKWAFNWGMDHTDVDQSGQDRRAADRRGQQDAIDVYLSGLECTGVDRSGQDWPAADRRGQQDSIDVDQSGMRLIEEGNKIQLLLIEVGCGGSKWATRFDIVTGSNCGQDWLADRRGQHGWELMLFKVGWGGSK